MQRVVPLLLSLAMSLPLFAQTTYTGQSNFVCSAASPHPVQYAYQFTCRGIPLADAPASNITGVPTSYFFSVSYDYLDTNIPQLAPWPSSNNANMNVTLFGVPNGTDPGQLQFTDTFTDGNGVNHNATVKATWVDQTICGGRGCYWHAPKLLTNSITIN